MDDPQIRSRKTWFREMAMLQLGKEAEAAKVINKKKPIPLEQRGYKEIILVVDDDQSFLELTANILEKHGFDCLTAQSVEMAREILFARSGIVLIISDLRMPEEDGYALLNFVRENLRFRHIPVVVSSSVNLDWHVMRAIQLGARDYLTKPVSEEALVRRVRQVLKPGKGTILIVTDCDLTANILKGMLSRAGYHILEAATGSEAEELLIQQRASAVLTELVLTDMTGLDLLGSVVERFLDIPVVFLADPHMNVFEEEIIAAGAHGLVKRPIRGPELLHKFASLHIKV